MMKLLIYARPAPNPLGVFCVYLLQSSKYVNIYPVTVVLEFSLAAEITWKSVKTDFSTLPAEVLM